MDDEAAERTETEPAETESPETEDAETEDAETEDAETEDAREHTVEEIAEIEAERERRLDPENRPDNAIVDNSDADLPTVQEFEEIAEQEKDDDAPAGSTDPSQKFRDLEYSEEEKEEIAAERERRLDPENRPDNVEIDNTGRTFEDGKFVD